MARRLGEFAVRFTPQNAIQQVAKKLDMAGNPGRIDPTLFFAFRFFGIPLGLVVIALGKILPEQPFCNQRASHRHSGFNIRFLSCQIYC